MDWVPEQSRYVYAGTQGPMPEPVARSVFRDMLLGIDYRTPPVCVAVRARSCVSLCVCDVCVVVCVRVLE